MGARRRGGGLPSHARRCRVRDSRGRLRPQLPRCGIGRNRPGGLYRGLRDGRDGAEPVPAGAGKRGVHHLRPVPEPAVGAELLRVVVPVLYQRDARLPEGLRLARGKGGVPGDLPEGRAERQPRSRRPDRGDVPCGKRRGWTVLRRDRERRHADHALHQAWWPDRPHPGGAAGRELTQAVHPEVLRPHGIFGVIAGVVQHALQSWWAPALAFAAGTVSCASPCVLPLLPGYVAFVAGGDSPTQDPKKAAIPILLFIAGFTVVFTFVFGFAASSISQWLRLPTGQRLAGGVVLGFGLFIVLYALGARLPWLYREERPLLSRVRPGAAGAFPLGMAFAVGWTPCIGPVLGAILTLAAAQATTGRTLVLLLAYSLGLGLPFFLLGMGMRWGMGASRIISRNYRWIAGTGGLVWPPSASCSSVASGCGCSYRCSGW